MRIHTRASPLPARCGWSSSFKQSPLREVSTGEETDVTAILPIRHPVNDLAAAAVLLTAAVTIRLRHPHNLQNSGHGADGWHCGAGNGRLAMGRRTAAGFLTTDVMAGAGG